jgi:hypothetical protein
LDSGGVAAITMNPNESVRRGTGFSQEFDRRAGFLGHDEA